MVGLQVVTHVVLFLLVARQDADLLDVAGQETTQHGVAEATSASGDEEDFVFEYGHFV